jgi:hypothetical protein
MCCTKQCTHFMTNPIASAIRIKYGGDNVDFRITLINLANSKENSSQIQKM